MTANTTAPVLPNNEATIRDNDVLLGRGGQTNKHFGNKRYRSIVLDHQGEYLQARKKDKIVIARKIVAIVHQNGGRFLKLGATSQWEEVPDERAQAKTSQALREGLDVRNQTVRNSKMPRRDSASSSAESPPSKRVKATTDSVPPALNSPTLFSKSDVTDSYAL
ncbi:hypothetical protein ACA910_003190 [Epithemia clementina (nom. ined.)]